MIGASFYFATALIKLLASALHKNYKNAVFG